MKFTGESGPQFGDSLQDEVDSKYSHLGNGTSEADKTKEIAEENTPAVEETPILNDPEGASDDALFGVDEHGRVDNLHTDEDELVLFKKGKRVETLETIQPIRKRSKAKARDIAITQPISNEASTNEEVTGATKRKIEFANPISDEEFEKRKEIQSIIAEIADFVDKAEFIPADLYTKAQVLNDPFLNDYILSLPDNTVVFLDDDGNKTRTIFQIREDIASLNEQKIMKQKELDTQRPSEISETQPQRESLPSSLEGLFSIAETKDELIAIIAKSTDLESGLQGTHQTYSKDDLIALINATWNGEVGIDHLPRTAGFREAVDRVREHERDNNLYIAKQKTAEELAPAMQATIEMENVLGVPEAEQIYGHDKKNDSFVYNYTNYPRTEANRKKNTGIFGRLWARLKGQR